MRKIGAAAGVAAVSSVLVAGTGPAGFHTAFAVIGLLAFTGVATAACLPPRSSSPRTGKPAAG